jgi:hypothetical protein
MSALDPLRISRVVCLVGVVVTIALVMLATGPFGNHRASGEMVASLLLLPVLAAWAVGPYAVANRLAQDAKGRGPWLYVGVQVLSGLPVIGIYVQAYVVEVDTDPQMGLVFAILPIYQFCAVVAVYFGLRLWRRKQDQDE